MKHRAELLSFCAMAVAMGAAAPALAQAAAGQTTVQELVVTAERRGAENLLAVPMAVDAYAGASLTRQNVQSLQDLNKIDPSLAIQSRGADQEQVIIRGISSTTGTTTGIYVDEAPLLGGFNANILGDNTPVLAMHDIDHVEVLKGPQGTLFGTGSMDGTLRIITNKPNLDTYQGFIEGRAATVGDGGNGYYDGNGMINIPLVKDQLALRAVAWGEEGGGYINQTTLTSTTKDVNNVHLYGGRIEALWQPNEQFSLLGSINYQHTHVDGSQSWTLDVGPLLAPSFEGGTEEGPFPPYQNHSPSQEPYNSRYVLYTLTGTYDLGFGSIIATGSYGNKNQLELIDTSPSDCSFTLCEGGPGFPAVFSAHSQFHDWTGEIRFSSNFKGPFQIVAGAYYEDDALLYDGVVINASGANGAEPCNTYANCVADGLVVAGVSDEGFGGVSPVEFANQDSFRVQQYAFYGQVDFKILPSVTLTAGARYFSANLNDEQLTQENIAPTTEPNGTFDGGWFLGAVTTPYVSSMNSAHESKPTFNFSLRWQATPDVSFYARAASGFRIGGVNEAATIASQEGIPVPATFGPDTLWDYEGGAKVYLFQHRLFVDAAVYHIDWSGEQEDALAAGVFNYTLNVGSSKINGVELNLTAQPTPGLTIAGGFNYVDATLSTSLPADVVSGGTPGTAGDRSPFVPKVSLSGQAEYEHALNGDVRGYIQGDFVYRSDSFSGFEPTSAASLAAGVPNNFYTELPSYILIDVKAGVRFHGVDLGVFCNNLSNNAAYLGLNPALDAVRVFSPPPRTVGVDLSARF